MFRQVFQCLGYSLLFFSPVAAQFGVAGNRKKARSFQELNEQAKKMQEGGAGLGGLGDLNDLKAQMGGGLGSQLDEMMKLIEDMDPEELERQMKEAAGPQVDEMMKMMNEMSPEKMEEQMKAAMDMMQSGDIMKNLLENQDEILRSLEESGLVSAEEMAKFKTDPEYFTQKMQESFDQVSQLFSDPDVLNAATESMKGVADLLQNPEKLDDMMADVLADLQDDDKIEEARQLILNDPDASAPLLKDLFDGDEMQEIINDPKKWREAVKEGRGFLNQGAADGVGAAGVGEL